MRAIRTGDGAVEFPAPEQSRAIEVADEHRALVVEYSLTPMARELHAELTGLVGWAERHRSAIAEARAA